MSTVAQSDASRICTAYRALLDDGTRDIEGIVLVDPAGAWSFSPDETGVWQTIPSAERSRIFRLGRIDLITEAAIADGDLFLAVDYRQSEHARVVA